MISILIIEVDEEITLKMMNKKDAEELFAITDRSRDYLREWLPWLDYTKSKEDSLQFIMNNFQLHAERKGVTLGIFYRGSLAGVAGYNELDWTNKIAYIGYWLDIEHQGKGIMTRAVRALVDHAFDQYKLNRIDIRAAYDNKKSQAIPKRLGFQKEGLLRQAEWLYDHYVDHLVFSMLQADWEKLS